MKTGIDWYVDKNKIVGNYAIKGKYESIFSANLKYIVLMHKL